MENDRIYDDRIDWMGTKKASMDITRMREREEW